MAFVLKKQDSYFWPVILKSPKDGGGFEEQSIELQFKRLKAGDLKKLVEQKKDDTLICAEIIVGWKNVSNEKGDSIPFSETNLFEVLDCVGFSSQIVSQYLESISGAITKN